MRYLISIITVIILSCSAPQKEFSIEDWSFKNDSFYTKRKFLVDDIINNKLHKGMKLKKAIDLLGDPGDYNNTPMSIEYEIEEKYGWDIDPVRGSYVQIKFNVDSVVTDIALVKWKK